MKSRNRKYIAKQNRDYSPYCPICSACGEEGCCSAMMCRQHPDGDYCKRYLKDLRFGYMMFTDMYNLVSKEEMDKIYDKNYALIYEADQ